ncbi:prepilin-type N-terminal cleavage/methylation domain-containing protein [bacterium]|nr:MAG: prepilin-type N-terminal cleavage/methylation domain-containing protein [bacterium]
MAASRWNEKGFSFVELMVALAIFAASFGVLLAGHTAASRQEAHARRLFTASALLRNILTETELGGYPSIAEDKGDFGENFPGYAWTRKISEADITGMLTSTLTSLGIDPAAGGMVVPAGLDTVRKVVLTIDWEENQKPFHVTMTYYAVAP